MIIACPLCSTRYLIPASLFAAGPRTVRCAKCSHSWAASPPNEIDVVGISSFTMPPHLSEPQAPPPIPPGSNVPAIRKEPMPIWLKRAVMIGSGIAALVIFLWLILDRKDIMEQWPATKQVYDTIGLHIYYTGEGLTLDSVRSELKYEDGIMKLVVEGKINNTTGTMQKVPDMTASAIGSDGEIMQSWQIDAPTATLESHESAPFQSSINAPKGTVVNVNLNFIEPKNGEQ